MTTNILWHSVIDWAGDDYALLSLCCRFWTWCYSANNVMYDMIGAGHVLGVHKAVNCWHSWQRLVRCWTGLSLLSSQRMKCKVWLYYTLMKCYANILTDALLASDVQCICQSLVSASPQGVVRGMTNSEPTNHRPAGSRCARTRRQVGERLVLNTWWNREWDRPDSDKQ